MKAVIIYTTEGGNTDAYTAAAQETLKALGIECERKHVDHASPNDLKACDFFILAEPTWGDGEHYDNWIPFDKAMQKADLKGTKGAVIAGCDRSYSQYGAAVHLMEDTMLKAGAQILQRGLMCELKPTDKFYAHLKTNWLPNLLKRAKGELPVEANTPRMDIHEVSAMMGIAPPAAKGAGATADAANAAQPPKKAVIKVLPPPADPIAPARSFERKYSTIDKGRRAFTQLSTYGSIGIITGLTQYFFFPGGVGGSRGVSFEPKLRFPIGPIEDYQVGTVDTRWLATKNIWVVKEPTQLYVVDAVCTHLGCTPDWKENENKYKCPCHGSGYYRTGENFEGPAPKPMAHAFVEIDPSDGQIWVDRNRKFWKDQEQWGLPNSFLKV
jgi:cytochrome b6-f complex iron-sulfur subunit